MKPYEFTRFYHPQLGRFVYKHGERSMLARLGEFHGPPSREPCNYRNHWKSWISHPRMQVVLRQRSEV